MNWQAAAARCCCMYEWYEDSGKGGVRPWLILISTAFNQLIDYVGRLLPNSNLHGSSDKEMEEKERGRIVAGMYHFHSIGSCQLHAGMR